MLNIPEEFFEDEVRCDFLVPELMKRTWAAEMEMLSQLQVFFKEHGITYYAECGTLLGAVRHQGFVPWDDDIDICMKREDYMHFLEVADQLPYPLRVMSIYNNDSFRNFHAIVSNTRKDKLDWDEERIEMYHGCPFIINIDIFPFDYIPRDEEKRKRQKLLYNIAYVLVHRYESECSTLQYKNDIATLEEIGRIKFDKSKPLLPQISQWADKIAAMYGEADADYIDYYPKMVHDVSPSLHNKQHYSKTVMLPFECIEVAAPVEFEKAANEIYGDYRVFSRGGGSHDYPFYKKQLEYFQLMLELEEQMENAHD